MLVVPYIGRQMVDRHFRLLEICHVHDDTDVKRKLGRTVDFLEAFKHHLGQGFFRFVIF